MLYSVTICRQKINKLTLSLRSDIESEIETRNCWVVDRQIKGFSIHIKKNAFDSGTIKASINATDEHKKKVTCLKILLIDETEYLTVRLKRKECIQHMYVVEFCNFSLVCNNHVTWTWTFEILQIFDWLFTDNFRHCQFDLLILHLFDSSNLLFCFYGKNPRTLLFTTLFMSLSLRMRVVKYSRCDLWIPLLYDIIVIVSTQKTRVIFHNMVNILYTCIVSLQKIGLPFLYVSWQHIT